MRRKLIVGNWKMNGSLVSNQILLEEVKSGLRQQNFGDVAVCVPAPYFAQCQKELANASISWGGQNLSCHEQGAYTGEVSAEMLLDFGCRYVIVGHSERRSYYGEDDQVVAQKVLRALSAGLMPILCVGESLSERESGLTEAVVGRQIDAVLSAVESAADLERIVVAYEPVWAIGTGRTATPQMAQDVHAFLRSKIAVKSSSVSLRARLLYGGSMKPDNAKDLLSMPDIDGGLIGGASLKAMDFLSIIKAGMPG